jgi:hypothetical protein
MDWAAGGRRLLRYGGAYAGATVLVVGGATRSELAVAGLFVAGLLLSLVVFVGGGVRTSVPSAGRFGDDVSEQLADTHVDRGRYLPVDGKLLCYGLGLAVFGFGGMVVLGG